MKQQTTVKYDFSPIVDPLLTWYRSNARVLPWRENRQGYRVWLSEIMLQQTRVETVIPYYLRFLERYPDIKALACGGDEELMKLWEGLGYYSRARNLKKAAQVICREYAGVFPSDYEQILKLPGIGEYTAGAIASIAFEQPRAAVDGNVMRVMARLTEDKRDIGDVRFRRDIEKGLEIVYPEGHCGEFTQSLMELGATVCLPNGIPKCEVCPLGKLCRAGLFGNNRPLEYPVKKAKPEKKRVDMTVFLLWNGDKLALRRRPEGGLLSGMWELPNTEGILSKEQAAGELYRCFLADKDISKPEIKEYCRKKHVFSHVEWNMCCYEVKMPENGRMQKTDCPDEGDLGQNGGKESAGGNSPLIWVTREQLDKEYALPAAFGKLLGWERGIGS